MVMPKKHFTLKVQVKWQQKIIRHDKWVLHTRSTHHHSVVKFAKRQLKWTTAELRESLSVLQAVSYSGRYLQSSSICWDCWDRVAICESSLGTGHAIWNINTGNTFYGGLQFTITTWNNSGGNRYADRADHATREQQIIIASNLSLSNWPVCGASY